MSEQAPAKTVSAALVGYGYAGKTFHAPLISATEGLVLEAVVSSDASKVKAVYPGVKVYSDAAQAFADQAVDLIVIATPNVTHFELARQALLSGKNVVVDKPFATTVDQARELVALSQQCQLVLSVFHNRRWDSDFLTLKEVIASGVLGEINYLESHIDRFRPQVRQRWRESAGPGAGLWNDLGPHLIDQALELFGIPDTIYGDMAIQRQAGTAVDYFHVQLTYGTTRVVLHAGSLVAAATPRYVVHGTEGSFIKPGVDPQEEALKRGELPDSPAWGKDDNGGEVTTYNDGVVSIKAFPSQRGDYTAYYRALARAITTKTAVPVTARQGLLVMQMLELGEKSAVTGRRLNLSDVAELASRD